LLLLLLQELVYPWAIGELYAVDILGDLVFGAAGWMNWNTVLLSGTMFPWWRGGPNHDNTTNFGDPVLFEYNATGSQRLQYLSSYYIIGHVSRFARPGAVRVDAGGAGVAAAFKEYDAVRAHALGQSSNGTLPLVTAAFVAPDGATASVVVLNPSDAPVAFKLRDVGAGAGPRAAQAVIPAHAIQTYTYAL